MANYRLSIEAREDLIRIHQYGVTRFGETQADKYFDSFFECFEIIAQRPYSFESIDAIKAGYRRCVWRSDSVFFRVNDGVVEIMAIIGKQDLSKIL
jgi:toxin ParE1/3/4